MLLKRSITLRLGEPQHDVTVKMGTKGAAWSNDEFVRVLSTGLLGLPTGQLGEALERLMNTDRSSC